MMAECFSCGKLTSECYTLTLEDSKVLNEVLVCPECISAFRAVEWIELEEISVPTSQ